MTDVRRVAWLVMTLHGHFRRIRWGTAVPDMRPDECAYRLALPVRRLGSREVSEATVAAAPARPA